MILYRVARALVSAVCRVVFRVRVVGAGQLPDTGPYVLAPSHRSIVDILVLSTLTTRRLRFMGKVELFRIPVLGPLFSALGGFPVERGAADRKALRAAAQVLADGEPLVIYPEGTRRSGPEITELHHGAVYLAARADVPIFPVGIGGSEQILPSGRSRPNFDRVAIVVGEPLAAPRTNGTVRRSQVVRTSGELRRALQRCFDEASTLAGVDERGERPAD